MIITIYRRLLPRYNRYMRDGNELDHLAQIIGQLSDNNGRAYKYKIPDKCVTPQDMKIYIAPFTYTCRNVIRDTSLTQEILKLDIGLPELKEPKLQELLLPYHIELNYNNNR